MDYVQYNRYLNTKQFYTDTFSTWMKHEAQNTLPLGNVILGNAGGEPEGWRNTENWFMASVTNSEGAILLSAIMTPPFNITMYETDNQANDDAVLCLCNGLIADNVEIPGITSENNLAERFSKAYTTLTGQTYLIQKNLRIYTLETVNEDAGRIGALRKAEMRDMCFLPYWYKSFNEDCHISMPSVEDCVSNAKRAVEKGMLYVLEEDGMPVSMASALREVLTGRAIGSVYTPPYFRKKGYAGSCVAKLSRIVLESGYKYCSLFTNLANPTSNKIYQEVGYKPICDYNQVSFK